jgi:hypothetical protein
VVQAVERRKEHNAVQTPTFIGRVAYVYMPDTAFGGLTSFTRYFFSTGKEGVIIDERFNGGGAMVTDIVEILNRKLLSIVTPTRRARFTPAERRHLRTESDDHK